MTFEELCAVYVKDETKFNWYNIFYNFEGKTFEEVRDKIVELGGSRKRLPSKGVVKFLPNLRREVLAYENKTKTCAQMSEKYGFDRATAQGILWDLGKLRSVREARNVVVETRPDLREHLSKIAKDRCAENIKLYGTIMPTLDSETNSLMNFSKTAQGREIFSKIAKEKISKDGFLMPVKNEKGETVHYRQTENGRKTSFVTTDYETGLSVNYRKTAEGRRLSSETVRNTNDCEFHDSREEDLYIVCVRSKADNNYYFKVGRSADFMNHRKWSYLNSWVLEIRKCLLYTGLNTTTLEKEYHSKFHKEKGTSHFYELDKNIGVSEWYIAAHYKETLRYFKELGVEFKEVNIFY